MSRKTGDVLIGFWEYFDGSCGMVKINTDDPKNEIVTKFFENLSACKSFIKKQKRAMELKGLDVTVKEYDLCLGLESLSDDDAFLLENSFRSGMGNFFSMLSSCGTDQKSQAAILTIVSAILASYLTTYVTHPENAKLFPLHEKMIAPSSITPTLLVSDRTPVFDMLRAIVESVAVETSPPRKGAALKYHAPPVLPDTPTSRRILDDAHILFGDLGDKKDDYKFPVVYQSTGVLINAKAYSSRDLLAFQKQNFLATVILYGGNSSKCLWDPIQVDGKPLQNCATEDWDVDLVQEIMCAFVVWLKYMTGGGKLKKALDTQHSLFYRVAFCEFTKDDVFTFERALSEECTRIDAMIAKHNAQRGSIKIQGSYWHYLRLQLLALYALLLFFRRTGMISPQEMGAHWRKWQNLLLPGSQPEADVERNLPVEQRSMVIPQRDSKELFERTVCSILEAGFPSKFPFYPGTQPTASSDPWGCLRKYHDKKNDKDFHALIFQSKKLKQLAKEHCPVQCNWEDLIIELRKQAPDYLYPVKTCRLWGTSAPQSAIIVDTEKASFLPPEMLSRIDELFQSELCKK